MSHSFDRILTRAFYVSALLWGMMMTSGVFSSEQPSGGKSFSSTSSDAKLLELYTSQGCSSCPPAERWISNLKNDQRLWKTIFPVAFHVDYWDYIGWKDEFAKPQFGKRQRIYQYLGNIRQVATPGFVIGGVGWNGWFRGQRIAEMDRYAKTRGNLLVSVNGQNLKVNYTSKDESELKHSYKVNIAVLGFDLKSKINAGENHGRTLQQDFVVQELNSTFLDLKQGTSNEWSGQLRLPMSLMRQNHQKAIVAWVSYGNNPVPTQVAGGWI